MGRLKPLDPAEKLLDLKVCDPAMGSGHFLVNLVDYLADRVITAMAEAEATVDGYLSPLTARIDDIRTRIMANAEARGWTIDEDQLDDRHIVRRMVLKRCVYGVDKNPMAVELAKVALWLHTFTVGAPLSFLDHHLRCGDSLFGSWVRTGIDRAESQGGSLWLRGPITKATSAAASMQVIEGLTDAEIAEAHRSADIFAGVEESTTPLNAFLSVVQAFGWLNRRDRDDTEVLGAYFAGVFGDPIDIALGTVAIEKDADGPLVGKTVNVKGSSQGSVQLWPVPWLISQALSSTYVAGEHRLYLERNCRLSESPAHGTRRKSRGACQCQGAEQSARVRPSGKTSAKVQAAFHECSWFVAL